MIRFLNSVHYATRMHADQKRKYTGEPYMVHCLEVADMIANRQYCEEIICAAVLHDTLEDTKATFNDIVIIAGKPVAEMVRLLTDVDKSFGNREARKALDRHRIFKAPARVQVIKLADLISNTSTIVKYDPGFAKQYLKEKRALLEVISPESDPVLYNQALYQLNQAEEELNAYSGSIP